MFKGSLAATRCCMRSGLWLSPSRLTGLFLRRWVECTSTTVLCGAFITSWWRRHHGSRGLHLVAEDHGRITKRGVGRGSILFRRFNIFFRSSSWVPGMPRGITCTRGCSDQLVEARRVILGWVHPAAVTGWSISREARAKPWGATGWSGRRRLHPDVQLRTDARGRRGAYATTPRRRHRVEHSARLRTNSKTPSSSTRLRPWMLGVLITRSCSSEASSGFFVTSSDTPSLCRGQRHST